MKTMIVLPDELGEELKKTVPVRQRSRFIAVALEKQLRLIRQDLAIRQASGAWTDKNHPHLTAQFGVNRYLAGFRNRLKRNGG